MLGRESISLLVTIIDEVSYTWVRGWGDAISFSQSERRTPEKVVSACLGPLKHTVIQQKGTHHSPEVVETVF